MCGRAISHGPVFFPGVVMSLAFSTTVLIGDGLCAAPPETVEQKNMCWLSSQAFQYLSAFNTVLL